MNKETDQILLVYDEGKEYFIKNSIMFPTLDRALEFVRITGIQTYQIFEVTLIKGEKSE